MSDSEVTAAAHNIPLRAYQLWEEAGRPEGRADEFYFRAEEEFRQLLEAHLREAGERDKAE